MRGCASNNFTGNCGGNMTAVKRYLLPALAVFALLLYVEITAPRPVDWTPSFSRYDKIPYGSYVLYDLLSDYFPGQEVITCGRTIYETIFEGEFNYDSNYIFINSSFNIDELETAELLTYATAGGHVLIAAEQFNGPLTDTLRFATRFPFRLPNDSVSINLSNPALRRDSSYVYRNGTTDYFFARFDTARTVVLGRNSLGHANFIRLAHGSGAIYLSTVPYAFTNYNALYHGNIDYLSKALSYLPRQPVYWDEYYKVRRQSASTPLRFILNRPALKWAYYLTLAGVLLFIIFEGKRRQRIIPVVPPLSNTTVQFVQTVGRLYYLNGDHKNLAEKKISHFLEHLRNYYYLKTDTLSEALYQQIAEKSGIPRKEVDRLFHVIRAVQRREEISEAELLQLHQLMETFYQQSER